MKSERSVLVSTFSRCDRRVEARPSGARLELRIGAEQRVAAADTSIETLVVILGVLVLERALGALFARDLVLFRGQLLAPFRVRLDNLIYHDESLSLAGIGEFDDRYFDYTRRARVRRITGRISSDASFGVTECDDCRYRGNRRNKRPPPDDMRVLTIRLSSVFSQLSVRSLDHCIIDNSIEARAVPETASCPVPLCRSDTRTASVPWASGTPARRSPDAAPGGDRG